MLVLTLDAKNNQIRIEDNDLLSVASEGLAELGKEADTFPAIIETTQGKIKTVELNYVDFEGMVLNLIDHKGNFFSTEVIGLVGK